MPPRKKTENKEVLTESYKHKDKRINIPTQENSHLVIEDEPKKKTYSFDPSLDPQLVWSGKQEAPTFEVDTVPLFIQETIDAEHIIKRMKTWNEEESDQIKLFGYKTEIDSILRYYSHESDWTNRMILGDSLLAMNSLLEKENMKGKVQCVYIDPPYGIKFGSNWQVSTKKRDVKDKEDDFTRQPEQIKAFRDTWELGIHSYLSYMRERLVASRELLTESGSCFVQISDENVHLVRNLMDEVFGSENFVSQITFRRKINAMNPKYLWTVNDYIVLYSKNIEQLKYRKLFEKKNPDLWDNWNYLELIDWTRRKIMSEEIYNPTILPKFSKVFASYKLAPAWFNSNAVFDVEYEGKTYHPPLTSWWRSWKTNIEWMRNLIRARRVIPQWDTLRFLAYYEDFPYWEIDHSWEEMSSTIDKSYAVQTAEETIKRCILMTTDPGDIVLDPTCGSGTTAFVAEQWGRRWITIDTSRVALALARTRLMTATYPYYSLKNGQNIKDGFQYKTVPHVTLKSLANDLPPEDEILYDQPKVEKSMVRVSGPFTVESLSPHRARKDQTIETTKDWISRVVENIRRAGVQTGIREERLEFTTLDTLAGEYIQAHGEYLENGQTKRVALAIGPEYGSVDDDYIRMAIKEASKYFDLLVIAGVSFDGSAFTEKVPEFLWKLRLLKAKINPDLSMGDILKKTGTGNLFLAFGEPDISVNTLPDGNIEIVVNGVDVYDATKWEVRSGKVDEIACWFIDTNYDEDCFFVQHAYFTWANKPYDRLKKALKAEIDEELWERLYTNKSRPFPRPKTGKIAIKVINHFGDEVMKIITL